MNKQNIAWLPALLWTGTIFILSTRGKVSMSLPFDFVGPDKIAHLGSYALLCWLILWAIRIQQRLAPPYPYSWVIMGCILYGLGLEVVQKTWFPDRYFEWGDFLANSIGVFAGWLFFHYFYPKAKTDFFTKKGPQT